MNSRENLRGSAGRLMSKTARGAVVTLCAFLLLLQSVSTAEAGFVDRVKNIYQLPEQLDEIQKKYDAAKLQLELQNEKLSESIRQSKETEEKLIAQNQQLQAQKDELQQRLQTMEQQARDKEARTRKLTMLAVTAALLVVGYFVTGRFIRWMVWRRARENLRS